MTGSPFHTEIELAKEAPIISCIDTELLKDEMLITSHGNYLEGMEMSRPREKIEIVGGPEI